MIFKDSRWSIVADALKTIEDWACERNKKLSEDELTQRPLRGTIVEANLSEERDLAGEVYMVDTSHNEKGAKHIDEAF